MKTLIRLPLFLFGLTLLGMVAVVGFARQTQPSQWMLFNENGRFYRMKADGSEKTWLTDMTVSNVAWSPNQHGFLASGRQWGAAPHDIDLYWIDHLGRTFRPLAQTANRDFLQVWSPSGDALVFSSLNADYWGMLYTVNLDGSELRPITPDIFSPNVELWTADGEWILLSGTMSGSYQLFRVRPDGSGFQSLTPTSLGVMWGGLSPNGDWIIFANQIAEGQSAIYQMRFDGSQQQNLTPDVGSSDFPYISPDGEWIIYRYQAASQSSLRRMRLDGTDDQALTGDAGHKVILGIAPDGDWLYFTSQSSRNTLAYRVRLDGSQLEGIGTGLLYNYIDWSPDGRWFTYLKQENDYQLIGFDTLESHAYILARANTIDSIGFGVWSPDSRWVYFQSYDGGSTTLKRVRPNGQDRQEILSIQGEFNFVAWSPIIDLSWSRALLTTIAILSILFGTVLSFLPRRLVQDSTIL